MLFRTLVLKTANFGPFKNAVTKWRVFRPLVRRFVAGETMEDAVSAAENLASDGYLSTLDLLGENVDSEEAAEQGTQAYLTLIDLASQSPHQELHNISIKLTALGLDQSLELAKKNYHRLLMAAEPKGVFVRVDMEASEYTDRTLDLVESAFARHKNTGTVLQSNLRRTADDIERMLKVGCRIRIVKGAYLEPEEEAFQEKGEVDERFEADAKRLLEGGCPYLAIASHDQKIIERLQAFIKESRIKTDAYEWQVLYGVNRKLARGLKEGGENMRIYIPFGEAWYPYFTRRLAERPANLFFILKSLFRG